MAESSGSNQLFDLWKRKLEESTQAWTRLVGQTSAAPAPPPDPAAFWQPVLDQGVQTWAKLFAQTPASPELVTQWKQFLDQWIAAWSKVLEQSMGTEAFAQAMGKQLEGFLSVAAPVKKAAEQQVEAGVASLGLPSRSQVIGLAKQIAGLEEKIEAVEDRIDAVLARLDAAASASKKTRE